MVTTAGAGSVVSDARETLISITEECGTRFTYQPPHRNPYPPPVAFCRRILFRSFIVAVFVGTALYLDLDALIIQDQSQFLQNLKLFSVPVVSLLFTWFHVWLALIMMFYPIEFYGIPSRPIVPAWLDLPINGWQGIVPRKAGEMAQRCCDKMIGNICTIEEFAERIDPADFWDNLQGVFGDVCAEVLKKILVTRWPSLWSALSHDVQVELTKKVCEETKKSFLPAMVELKTNINSILNIRQMAAEALANDPKMMVDIFRTVAARELVFITHVAAVMGFLLGLVQVIFYVAFANTWKYVDYVLLPVSGLIIGYFTNWLALKMTFSPIYPRMMCGNYINVQGVFLKRQKEAAEQMAAAICEKVIDARAMLDYMFRNPGSTGGVEMVIDIYRKHICASLDQQFGVFTGMAPAGVAQEFENLKHDVVKYSLEILPRHTKDIELYLDEAMQVKETLSWRLARVTPDEFEDIIHPIFKQDEWILLAVGGFLGIVIGLLQAWALQTINA
jgi:uncharacterized membrane protein YheB (UPF0754 family)